MALKAQQYQILKANDTKTLGTSLLIIPELRVLVLIKKHVGSGNEIVLHTKTRCRSVHERGFTAGQKTMENQDWAIGPPGLQAVAGRRGLWATGWWAFGPPDRWVVAGRGPRACF